MVHGGGGACAFLDGWSRMVGGGGACAQIEKNKYFLPPQVSAKWWEG